MPEKGSKYRARQVGGRKTKTIGFVPSPDIDDKLRTLAADQEVTVARVVDGLIRDGLEARASEQREEKITSRLEAILMRLEVLSLSFDDRSVEGEYLAKLEQRFIGATLVQNPIAIAYANVIVPEAFSDPICRAVIRRIQSDQYKPSEKLRAEEVCRSLASVIRLSEPETADFYEETLKRNLEDEILRWFTNGHDVASDQVDAFALRIIIRAVRRHSSPPYYGD